MAETTELELSYKYTDLIERAIDDFDSIFEQFVKKQAVFNGDTITVTNLDNGSIPTFNYSTIIKENFFRIKGLKASGNPLTDVIDKYDNLSTFPNSETGTLDKSDSDFLVHTTVPATGYYVRNTETGENLNGVLFPVNVPTTTLAIGSTIPSKYNVYEGEGEDAVLKSYKFTVDPDTTNNSTDLRALIKEVTINRAKSTLGLSLLQTSTPTTVDTSVIITDSKIKTALTEDELKNLNTDWYVIPFTAQTSVYNGTKTEGETSTRTNTIHLSIEKSINTQGYIDSTDQIGIETSDSGVSYNEENQSYDISLNTSFTDASGKKLYIKQGKVSLNPVGNDAVASITSSQNGISLIEEKDISEDEKENYFSLKSSITGLKATASVTEGYFVPPADGQSLSVGTINLKDSNFYVDKSTAAFNFDTIPESDPEQKYDYLKINQFNVSKTGIADGVLKDALTDEDIENDSYVNLKVGLGSNTESGVEKQDFVSTTEGYTKGESLDLTVKGEKTVYIKKGSASGTITPSVSFGSSNEIIVFESAPTNANKQLVEGTDYFKITATPDFDGTIKTQAGYVGTDNEIDIDIAKDEKRKYNYR